MAFDSFWDRAYRDGSHIEHWDPPEVPPELATVVAAEPIPDGAIALDIGCGAGVEAVYLAEQGFRVVGLDASPPALERARRRATVAGVEVHWRLADALDLPLADAVIDLAVDRGCFHVLAREDRPRYAREVARVLRPGGRFLLRGAREEDEELGVFDFDAAELDALFPAERFRRGPVRAMELVAPAGNLRAHRVLLRKRRVQTPSRRTSPG